MEHEVVSYKQAIILDEIGYDIIHWFGNAASLYDIMGYHAMYVNYGIMLSGINDGYISAPLKQQVFRWFREKYFLDCEIYLQEERGHKFYHYLVLQLVRGNIEWKSKNTIRFKTYEEAENACIDKLIELIKQ
jgi:hypothetical protein